MSVLRPFLAISFGNYMISFTKLKFRRSFLGAEWVYILIGSKVKYDTNAKTQKMQKMEKIYTNNKFFLQIWKKKPGKVNICDLFHNFWTN